MKKYFFAKYSDALPTLRGKNTLYPSKIWESEKTKRSAMNLFWEQFREIQSEIKIDQTSASEHERRTKARKEAFIENKMTPVAIRKRKKRTQLNKLKGEFNAHK